ncbi:unnamed protein product, partial [Linum tenue]
RNSVSAPVQSFVSPSSGLQISRRLNPDARSLVLFLFMTSLHDYLSIK